MSLLIINNYRQARHPSEISHTMTAGELIEYLAQFDPETPVITQGYDGNLYSGIEWDIICEATDDGVPIEEAEE